MTTSATESTPDKVKTLTAAEISRSEIINLCNQKFIIVSWPPTFAVKTPPALRTPTAAWDRLENCTLGSFFSIIVATRFCCTYQSLVAKELLLDIRSGICSAHGPNFRQGLLVLHSTEGQKITPDRPEIQVPAPQSLIFFFFTSNFTLLSANSSQTHQTNWSIRVSISQRFF